MTRDESIRKLKVAADSYEKAIEQNANQIQAYLLEANQLQALMQDADDREHERYRQECEIIKGLIDVLTYDIEVERQQRARLLAQINSRQGSTEIRANPRKGT